MSKLLKGFGYDEIKSGKTSGSRVAFISKSGGHIIRLHRPHPSPVLKLYQVHEIFDELQKKGVFVKK